MNKFLCFALLSFSCITPSPEITRIRDVANYIDPTKKVFIAFDIDGVLLTHEADLGSDHWCEHLIKQKVAAGLDRLTAYQQVLPLYFHLNLHLNLVPVEQTLVADIAHLKSLSSRACCLTARSKVLLERTAEQFRNHGLHFAVPEIHEHTFSFAKPCFYKHGVLWCGWNNKGAVVLAFLEKINYIPEAIIFVDDKQHNVDAVQKALEGTNIKFIGLRYAGCDHKASKMDHEKIEIELQEFLTKHPFTEAHYLPYV